MQRELRISTINGKETAVENVGVNACKVEYDKSTQTVTCTGVADAGNVAVYNLGGMQVGKATVCGENATVSLAGQPQGSYLLVIKQEGVVRTHKFVKW